MSRGDRREDIYLDDVDRQEFLKSLAEACQKTAWRVHAYCLMRNHFHLVVETPEPNLVDGMSWLLSTYTIRLNRRHKLSGHVSSGRYKSPPVDGSGDGYFKTGLRVNPYLGSFYSLLTMESAFRKSIMPRQMRVQYPGATYHVMSRGDRREDIYIDDVDRHDFLKTLAEACQKTAWQVHAYCLMRNHFHLVLEMPEGNLVEGMSWLLSTYTIRLNRRHKMSGHVFSGRYKSPVVDGSSSGYFKTVCDYVHLNPVRAGLLRLDESFAAYPWSSLSWYAAAREHRPSWIRVDRLLGAHGIPYDTPPGRTEFQLRMEARRAEEIDEETLESIRRDWCFGSEEFRGELVKRMEGGLGAHHSGALHLESSRIRAERIVAEELARLGWTELDLAARRKNAPEKLAIAARLRKETTLTVKEIAARVVLGTSKSANGKLHRFITNSGRDGMRLPQYRELGI